MRFVLAIVALSIAACLIGAGVAQRTIFLGPSEITLDAPPPPSGQPYTVVTNAALHAHPGQQSLTLSGSEQVVVAYGRENDVRGWLGSATYTLIDFDATTEQFTSQTQTGVPSQGGVPSTPATGSPAGSDLWEGQVTGTDGLVAEFEAGSGTSVLVASNGTLPAPPHVSVSWPAETRTPLAGPFFVVGLIFLVVGVILLLWGVIHMRRSRGPRRKSLSASAETPRRPITRKSLTRGRHGASIVAVSFAAGSVVLFSGCSPDYWPQAPSTPSASPLPAPLARDDLFPPAVSVSQARRIVENIAQTVDVADEKRDANQAGARLSGPALQVRQADYKIRATVPEYVGGAPIPGEPPALTLPQATDAWPRMVMTVVDNPVGSDVPPTVMIMTQATPRENYTVPYVMSLFETIPEVAPAAIGAPAVNPDSKLLLLQPNQIAAAYSDVLMNGESSQFASYFRVEGDDFRVAYGRDAKNRRKESIPSTASLEFSNTPGGGPVLSLATSDSGALVAVDIAETETVKPVQSGATVSQNGAASKALSGISASTKGITTVYGGQLLFHVPPARSGAQIALIGYNQALISSTEAK